MAGDAVAGGAAGEAQAADRSRGGSRRTEVRVPWRGLAALAFVAVSLVALVAVPAYFGREVAEAQERISDVLDPASRLSSNLSLLLARQLARVEAYQISGERAAFRDPYIAAIDEKDRTLQQLRTLALDLDVDVFERVSALFNDWTRWDFENQQIFDDPSSEPPAVTRARTRQRYAELERQTRLLDDAIGRSAAAGRRQMAFARRWQTRITFGLAFVALFGMVIVGRIGFRYRELTIEAETRGREAVRARREIDSLLEATGDGVLGIGLDGRCTSLNPVGCKLLGYTESEIRGRDVHDTLFHAHPDGSSRPRDRSDVLAALESGEPLDSGAQAVLWRRKRIPFPARWSLRPLVDGRELRGAVLTFTDISEIREKERALHMAIRQRDDVVSIVSHDLRNPLGVVLAAADLILDLPLDAEQRRRQAEIIGRSGRRMQRLIEDLLDVSKIEADALVVRPSAEKLVPILEEAADVFQDQADRVGVELVVEHGGGELEARVDRDRILQALANLIDNALRYLDEGGRIVLSVEQIGEELVVAVEDDGPGIPEEQLEYLFDRFHQTVQTRKGGAGLGLAIVKGVANAHQGRVEVTSRVGEWSRFTIYLPITGPEEGEERLAL